MVKYVPTYTKGILKEKRSVKDLSNDAYAMLFVPFSDFLYKSICCGYSFELPQLIEY